jgi:hypothetical protein
MTSQAMRDPVQDTLLTPQNSVLNGQAPVEIRPGTGRRECQRFAHLGV